jgi:hypothetical protein
MLHISLARHRMKLIDLHRQLSMSIFYRCNIKHFYKPLTRRPGKFLKIRSAYNETHNFHNQGSLTHEKPQL